MKNSGFQIEYYTQILASVFNIDHQIFKLKALYFFN